jgi:hypothetical protein
MFSSKLNSVLPHFEIRSFDRSSHISIVIIAVLSLSRMAISACPNPCGYEGQLCCASEQYCYTDSNNEAQCGNGIWEFSTATYLEASLFTFLEAATYSSFILVSYIDALPHLAEN